MFRLKFCGPGGITFLAAGLLMVAATIAQEPPRRPNVLLIAIDDLNDWVGCFGGHARARTPHLDRLAAEGGMVFQNAHCAGPVCGPSRSALLSGFMPYRTGLYGNRHNMLDSALVQTHATLPEYFSRHGYVTLSRGKISHRHVTPKGVDAGQWMYDRWEPSTGGGRVDPGTLTSRNRNLIMGKPAPPSPHSEGGGSEFAWGVTREAKEATRDHQTAQWAVDQLQQDHDQPFLLAVGLSKPHLPFFSPREFWDLYPKDGDYLPDIREQDFEDILKPNGQPAGVKSGDYLWLEQMGLLNEASRAYLACASYADDCVGVILEGLRDSRHAEDTIVVVWGDHGWHLGEKLRFRKATLWTEATRCPLIVRLPGSHQSSSCHRPVNLIDLYPTLIELCGLPPKTNLDGTSFAPLLDDPGQPWQPTLTVRGPGSVAVHNDRWNLIVSSNGVRELYDLESDPMEWTNRFGQSEFRDIQQRLEARLPPRFADPVQVGNAAAKSGDLDRSIRPRRQQLDLK